jgi:hypothetical protein
MHTTMPTVFTDEMGVVNFLCQADLESCFTWSLAPEELGLKLGATLPVRAVGSLWLFCMQGLIPLLCKHSTTWATPPILLFICSLYWGLKPGKVLYYSSYALSPLFCIWDRVLLPFCLGWAWICNSPASTSWVARLTGMLFHAWSANVF